MLFAYEDKYQEVLFSKCWQFRKMFKEKFIDNNHEIDKVYWQQPWN